MADRRKVTPTELLDTREQSWSKRLRGASLAAEVEIKAAHALQVAQVLGKLYARWTDKRWGPDRIFPRWPACTVVAVSSIAASDYRGGTFWPHLWKAVGYQGHPEDQAAWGKGFALALRKLGMPEFEGMPYRYVGPILMHAGIPTYCLGDYFRLIAHRREVEPGLDVDRLLEWALAPGHESRLAELDVPAQRFLRHGTVFARDFVERSFDLLDLLADSAPDLDGVGLPQRVVTTAQELVASGALTVRRAQLSSSGRASKTERPRLALDPFGRGLHVVLPATDAPDGTARWNVSADGVTTTVRSQAQWVGVDGAVPATTYAVMRPVRTVVVSMAGWEHQTELPVVDPKAPLLLFAEDGRRLPATLPLPPDVVWAVYPEQHELIGDGPLRAVIEGRLPLGWNGWRLRQVDLSKTKSLTLDGMPGTHRAVRGHSHPRIVLDDPLPGVATPHGLPVVARPPHIRLPGTGDAEIAWTIEVRPTGETASVFSRTVTGGAEALDITDLWDGFPRPLLGAYDIIVRGPLGRGTRRTTFVAEGLGARFTPAVRVFGPSGVVSAHVELTSAIGARAEPRVLALPEGERDGLVRYVAGARAEPLVVTPPHVQLLHERADEAPVWRAGPLSIPTDVFAEEPGEILVQVPGAQTIAPVSVIVGGAVVQTLPPTGHVRDGTARFDLTRIKDTVHEHQWAVLVLDVGRPLRVATVRPRQLARGAEHHGDHLRLVDCAPIEGLTAGVYPVRAPWREPEVVTVQDGTVPLPGIVRDAGPLSVMLQVDDPWVPVEWPRWPQRFLLVGAAGHLVSDDAEETALSRYVAAEGDLPVEVKDLSRVWVLVRFADRLRVASEVSRFRMECSRLLLRDPGAALGSLVELGLEPDQLIVALVSSGLAATAVPELERARKLWAVAPAAAVLAGGLSDDDCREAAERQCGESLAEILRTGTDPHASVGRFGPEAERLAVMPPEQFEILWQAAGIVPQALLDGDTRMAAARRLFVQRTSDEARLVGAAARYAASTAETLLANARAHEQVAARRNPQAKGGWRAVPAASAAFALIARTAARGDERCRAAEQNFRADWIRLATVAPELTTIDLVLAELLLQATETESSP
jgi:hypothetical protein